MKCSKRERCAVVVFAAVLVTVGAFCVLVGMWQHEGGDPQLERYLIGVGTLDLVLGVVLASGAALLGRRPVTRTLPMPAKA
jgi:hypothetical protein